jgi:hypothetical protein
MTRFDDDFEHDFGVIAERVTPSPTAWEEIQQRISDREPTTETEIIMLTDNTFTKRRWPLVAAAAAVAALAITGIALVNRGDEPDAPANPPQPAPTIAPAPDGAEEQTADDQTADAPVAESSALALPFPGATIEPGHYASDALGVPMEFDVAAAQTAPWALMNEEPGRLWINSDGSDQEFVAMGRLGSWYDATQARTESTTGLGSIPPDDIDGWIEQNGIIVIDSAEVEVGGRTAEYRRFRLDTTPGATADFCGVGAPCLWASTGSADVVGGSVNPLATGEDRAQSVWLIDMDEYEPVYVFAAARLGDDGNEQWITDVVQPIVDSIVLGDPAPAVEGGTARIPDRAAVTGEMTVTQTGERDINNPWPVERTGVLSGDIDGTYDATGISSPNGAEVTLDSVMDVTIDGFGTGTLTLRSYWVWTGDGATTATHHVIGGTGDLEGVTGFGTSEQISDFGFGRPFTATIELMLAPPTS